MDDVVAETKVDLNRECDQNLILKLGKHCEEWKLVGKHLGLTQAEIIAVNGDYGSVDEKRIGMLEKWKNKFAFNATCRAFIEALLAHGKSANAISAAKEMKESEGMLQY